MTEEQALLYSSIDEYATIHADTLTPAELWGLGETLEILESGARPAPTA